MNHRFGSLAAVLVAATLYLSTVCPTIPAGDSPELITAAHVLGVAHPPGYPLFTMLGAGADGLSDAGEPAWRINVGFALVAALAAGLTFQLARRASGASWPAAAGAAVSALSVVTWRHASGAEVFGLNVALNVGAVLAVLSLADALRDGRPARGAALLVGLLFGLGMSNHHTTSLVVLTCLGALGVRVITGVIPRAAAGRALSWSLPGALIGLTPYAYLPWAAARDPLLAWGQTDTLAGFWHHVTRADYGSLQLVSSGVEGAGVDSLDAPMFLLERLGPLTSWVAPLALAAAVFAVVRSRPVGDRFAFGLCAALALVTGPLFFDLFNAPLDNPVLQGVVERFMILPLAFIGVVVACGLAALPVAPRVRSIVCVALVVLLAARHHSEVDMSDVTFARDFGRDVLASVPEGALFFSRSDLVTNSVEYNQFVLGRRPDVLMLDQEKLTYPWYVSHAERRDDRFRLPWPEGVAEPPRYDGQRVTSETLIASHASQGPVAVVDPKDATWARSFELIDHGLVKLPVPLGQAPAFDARYGMDRALVSAFERPDPASFPHDSFEREGCRHYGLAFFSIGYTAEQVGALDDAVASYTVSAEALAGTEGAWRPLLNLGVVEQRRGELASAAIAWRACLDAWERHGVAGPDNERPPVDALKAAIAQAGIDVAKEPASP